MIELSLSDLRGLLRGVTQIAVSAGKSILEVYEQSHIEVALKSDRSPVTEADLCAHRQITEGLALIAEFPVLSEEAADIPYETRRAWEAYWLVDPLDGTREFVSRNGEFTVNIALIVNHVPVLGVVHAPVTGVVYAGAPGLSNARSQGSEGASVPAYREEQGRRVADLSITAPAHRLPRVVASRSHLNAQTAAYLERLGPSTLLSIGSSLKLCLVAEGCADVYPRLAPTSEWDTAAGHAVLVAAGGRVMRIDGTPLRYNTGPSLLNPSFIACGDPARDWLAALGS